MAAIKLQSIQNSDENSISNYRIRLELYHGIKCKLEKYWWNFSFLRPEFTKCYQCQFIENFAASLFYFYKKWCLLNFPIFFNLKFIFNFPKILPISSLTFAHKFSQNIAFLNLQVFFAYINTFIDFDGKIISLLNSILWK